MILKSDNPVHALEDHSDHSIRRGISTTSSTAISRSASLARPSSIHQPSINARSLSITTATPLSLMSTRRDSLMKEKTLKHRLPWLDGKSKEPRRPIPGSYDFDSDTSKVTTSSSEHSRAPLPKGSDSSFLKRDPSIRAIGSVPVLQSPKRPLIARKLSSAGSPGRPPPNLGDAPLDSSSRPSTSQYEGDVSPTDTRRARLSSPPAPSQAYTRHGGRSEPRRSGTLNEALTGLDNLMQEAVQLAQEAADQGRPEEFSQVLEEATHTLRRASAVSNRHRANLMQPLPASESESDYGSSDSSEDDTLVNPETTRSSATMLSTKALPIHVSVHPNKEGQKNSEHIDIVDDLHSLSGTPPHFYHPLSHESIVKDFAYGQARREPSQDAVSVATDGLPRRTSRLPAHHRNTPIEPLAAQQSTRQILDGVIHTVPPRGSSLPRRPSVQAETIPNPWRPRHANTELDVDYDTPRRRRTSRHLDVNENHFEDPRRQKRHDRNLDPETKGLSLKHRKHFSLRSHQGFSFGHHVRRQPIARKWGTFRKRITATIACISTGFIGYVIGVYAGEVPRIQYQVIDPKHYIIQGNIYLFLGLALSTFFFWPLPLLHGRKPYTLAALALALPLQFPQAVLVSAVRQPSDASFRNGLLVSRFFSGMALGFCNINFITTLFDLFGASLQSSNPHQELVIIDDVRRQGGGMGIWLGIWSWCFIGSIALGFLSGAGIIAHLNPEWGFYVTVIVGAGVLILNILAPETRRSPYRRSFTEFVDDDEKVRRRIARGEVKLHLESDGPKWWGQEVWAGIRLNVRMMFQPGFFVLASYLGWTYAEIVLVIVLLGSLLSRDYHMRPQYVGAGVMAMGIGALLAVPLSKAGIFSRDRTKGPRTDSMTFERQVTWTSHMVRRLIFMIVLPLAGIAYTLTSPGSSIHWIAPILFAGLIGFLSNLGIAECIGIIMETYDTSDLQPGANSRHRLASMASNVKRRRTNYSSFPRVTAGVFVSQTIGFLLAAAATGVGGVMTRRLSAQRATAITAGILLFITILLTLVLYRFKSVQVIPNHTFGTRRNSRRQSQWNVEEDEYWKPVVIGNPSGKMRRMSILELGRLSRWTEIRKLNHLIRENQT